VLGRKYRTRRLPESLVWAKGRSGRHSNCVSGLEMCQNTHKSMVNHTVVAEYNEILGRKATNER
jgi:hypothetical protein